MSFGCLRRRGRRLLLRLDPCVPLALGGPPAVLVVAEPPVAGDGQVLARDLRSTRSSRRSSFTKPASPCTNAWTGPAGNSSARTASTSVSPDRAGRRGAARRPRHRRDVELLLLLGPGDLDEGVRRRARRAAASSAAAIAGRALSSPASRCQSALGVGGVGAAGAHELARRRPARTAAAHGPASPSSPWTTKSSVSSRVAGSQARTVYVRVTGHCSRGNSSRIRSTSNGSG